MLDLGLRATIHSDDPAYFGGYIGENFRATAAARNLSREQVVTLARNSFLGSFLDDDALAAISSGWTPSFRTREAPLLGGRRDRTTWRNSGTCISTTVDTPRR